MARRKMVKLSLTQDEAEALLILVGEADPVASFEAGTDEENERFCAAAEPAKDKLAAALAAAQS